MLKNFDSAIQLFNHATNLDPDLANMIFCSDCGKSIIVPIYKCSVCSDFELCEKCKNKGQHNKEHVLYKIYKQNLIDIYSTYLSGNRR